MRGTDVIDAPVVLVDGATAAQVWARVLGPWLNSQRAGSISPAIIEHVEQMRLAGMLHLQRQRSARELIAGTGADLAPCSDHEPLSTAEVAERLHLDPHSVRRTAKRHGIEKDRRDTWSRAAVEQLAELYRSA